MILHQVVGMNDFPDHIKANLRAYASLFRYATYFGKSTLNEYFASFTQGKITIYYFPNGKLIKVYYNSRLINMHTGGWSYLLVLLKCFKRESSCN